MPPIRLGLYRGLNRAAGYTGPAGSLFSARNSRYRPGDIGGLWMLLGRSVFNSSPLPRPAGTERLWRLMPYVVDAGTSKLVAHFDTALWEADLGSAANFSMAQAIGVDGSTFGGFFSYAERLFYCAKGAGTGTLWVRESSGWVKGSLKIPTTTITADAQPGGSTYYSTKTLRYCFRVYDAATDTESAHSATVDVFYAAPWTGVMVTFTGSVAAEFAGLRGTHVRIYRSLRDEDPGLMYRVDGSGSGIPIADVLATYQFLDTVSNTTAQIQGLVRADGTEGTEQWAEHGGPFPDASGMTMFEDRAVVWGVPGRTNEVIGSARGYPEAFPVLWDGEYAYNLPFSSDKVDRVITCRKVGPYLVVWMQNSVWRISHFPDFTDPGFDRRIQQQIAPDSGIAGYEAVDLFSTNPDNQQASMAVYVSREHGPMFTDGYRCEPVVRELDWWGLADPAYASSTVVRNYPAHQELWIGYVPRGDTKRTKAIILDYSAFEKGGFRTSGPVDVRMADGLYAFGNDALGRFYIGTDQDPYVYVQDSGAIDAQQNVNTAGDMVFEVETPRAIGSLTTRQKVSTLSVLGASGSAIALSLEHNASQGDAEQAFYDTLPLGPGETVSLALVNASGLGHRSKLSYTGPSGTNYLPGNAGCAPVLRLLEYQGALAGKAGRVSGT